MDSEILCTISPDETTVTRQVAMAFTMMHNGSKDVTFINKDGKYTAKDIPDFGSGKLLEDVTYFYFYFKYGDTAEALMKNVRDIEFDYDDKEYWDVMEAYDDTSDDPIGCYWKICPRKDIVWKTGGGQGNSEVVLKLPQILCNGVVGTAYAYIQQGDDSTPTVMQIIKYPNPEIKDLKIVSHEPYYIGDTAELGWNVPNHANYTISLDGVQINQDTDDHKETVVIKYGKYLLNVQNKAGVSAQAEVSFKLDIIKNFQIEELSPSTAVFSWEIEDKNAADWKLKGFSIDELKPKEDHREISAQTTANRTFTLMAQPMGSIEWVQAEVDFVMPAIDSFTVKSKKVDKQDRLTCESIFMERNLSGFVSLDLIAADGSDEYTTSFCFACKGGGGGGGGDVPTYEHTFSWSGTNVEQYYITINRDKNGPFGKDVTSQTICNQDASGSATLEAEGQYKYTVTKNAEKEG